MIPCEKTFFIILDLEDLTCERTLSIILDPEESNTTNLISYGEQWTINSMQSCIDICYKTNYYILFYIKLIIILYFILFYRVARLFMMLKYNMTYYINCYFDKIVFIREMKFDLEKRTQNFLNYYYYYYYYTSKYELILLKDN